jgi:hypothetical protein
MLMPWKLRALPSLAAGHKHARDEIAGTPGRPPGEAAVTIARTKERPATARGVVRATGSLRPKILVAALAAMCAAVAAFGAGPPNRAGASPVTAVTARLDASTAPANPKKGVGTWTFSGVSKALADSGASWYYTWSPTNTGITSPSGVQFVPMIWGSADVNATALSQAEHEGSILLGFNEPDNANQSDMTVSEALSLWPQLMATGMTLGSPAVSADAATPGGWLDQFMSGAAARGYRVNFITVHWYGGDFATGPAVQQLQSYLQAIYDRYHLPIWLTEFALANFGGGTPSYPTDSQQAAFLTAATSMLEHLSYVQRYAWFGLGSSATDGSMGLFSSGPVATPVGQAFEAVDAPH